MYYDQLARASLNRYPAAIGRALQWLRGQDFTQLPAEKIAVEGEHITAQLLELTSRPAAELRPEQHRHHVDLHYLIDGEETIGVALDCGANPIAQPYDPARDLLFYESAAGENFINLRPGQFLVLYPEDIHRPTIATNAPAPLRKIVMKISAALF